MSRDEQSDVALCLGIEWTALFGRYTAYAVIVPLFLLGVLPGDYSSVAVVTVIVVLHNAFGHWAFATGREHLFFTWFNLAVYFVETCVLVQLTGVERSEAYLCSPLLIIGFSAYNRHFRKVLLFSAACALAYVLLIAVKAYRAELGEALGIVLSRALFIPICGGLVGLLSERLRRTEESALEKARALATSNATLRAILDNTAAAILVYNDDGRIVEANDRACEFLATSRRGLLRDRVQSFLTEGEAFPHGVDAGPTAPREVQLAYRGTPRDLELVVRSYQFEDRRFYVAVAQDITQAAVLEAAIERTNQRLDSLRHQLRHALRLRTDMLMGIADRLCSPVSAALGFCDLFNGEELGEMTDRQTRLVDICRRSGLRVLRLLQKTIEASRQATAGAEDG